MKDLKKMSMKLRIQHGVQKEMNEFDDFIGKMQVVKIQPKKEDKMINKKESIFQKTVPKLKLNLDSVQNN